MDDLNTTVASLARLLGVMASVRAGLPAGPTAPAANGAETQSSEDRDTTLAELQGVLDTLRSLGERVAETEAARTAAQEEARELQALVSSLRRRLQDKKLVLARERKRHARTRKKVVQSQELASARWRELRGERARAGRLERELAKEKSRWEALRGPVCQLVESKGTHTGPERMPLAELMRLVVGNGSARRRATAAAD
jgi:predicted RNase H-like nuclease (RuvC/YqgF family)